MPRLAPPFSLAFCIALAAAASAVAADPDRAFVPVMTEDFPDPHIIAHKSEYLAYATNAGAANVPMASSPDLISWAPLKDAANPKKRHDAMPELPVWARRGHTWAPEVMEVGGRYILYFTARHKESGQQCIGAAASADPRGPFRDAGPKPLVCQHDLGGTIDANPFRDADGRLYLYFKNDGNHPSANKPAQIWGQALSADGLSLVGDAVPLLANDKEWEGRVVEAPTMARHGEGYTMLFSANDYAWQESQRLSLYAIGYATCQGPLGPCADAPDNPLLYSFNSREAGCLSGPGHQNVFEAGGRHFIAFHAWAATSGCRRLEARRYLYVAPLGWKGAKPQIARSLRPAGK